jgi:hypothetical protein
VLARFRSFGVVLDGTDGQSTGAASLSAASMSPLLLALAALATALFSRRV